MRHTHQKPGECRGRADRLPRRLFSMIELLVVIAIIGILSSLLLPALGKAKGKAKAIICLGNLKQIYLCAELYCNDYPGTYRIPSRIGDIYAYWHKLLLSEGYVNYPPGCSTFNSTLTNIPSIFQCPGTNTPKEGWKWQGCHYGINGYLCGSGGVMNWGPSQPINDRPEKTCYFGEKTLSVMSDFIYPNNLVDFRHAKSTNAVYLDGHASAINYLDFPVESRIGSEAEKSIFWRVVYNAPWQE